LVAFFGFRVQRGMLMFCGRLQVAVAGNYM
jgi:hypothetical protein